MLTRGDEWFADSCLSVDADTTYHPSDLVDELSSRDLSESLAGARVPFRVTLWIAPLTGDCLPSDAEFFPVMGHDLSLGGVAFFLKIRPEFTSLVVALKAPSTVDYMEARVAHCTEVLINRSGLVRRIGQAVKEVPPDESNESAEPMILVGCQFVRRLPTEQVPQYRQGSIYY
jgi:hypothetical protein